MNNNTQPLILPIQSPWQKQLQDALAQVQEKLLIISPYIKNEIIMMCKEILCARATKADSLEIRVITRTIPEEFMSGSSDIDALQHLLAWPTDIHKCSVEIRAINNIHAKVWVCDKSIALVGSANATPSGLNRNIEYGLAISDSLLVSQILSDWEVWWTQATSITLEQLDEMQLWVNNIKNNSKFQQVETEIRERAKWIRNQIGEAPHMGSVLSLTTTGSSIIENREATSKLIEHETVRVSLQPGLLRVTDTEPEIQLDASRKNLPSTTEPQRDASRKNLESSLRIPQEPPWDVVANAEATSIDISLALWNHSNQVRVNEGFMSIGFPSILDVGRAIQQVPRTTTVPAEAIRVPIDQLWGVLLWIFPIVETVQRIQRLKPSNSFLQIETGLKYQRKRFIRCTWTDENRTSQAVIEHRGPNIKQEWSIALDVDNAVKLIFCLNSAIVSYMMPGKLDINLLLESNLNKVKLFYPISDWFRTIRTLDRQQEMGIATISYEQAEKSTSPLTFTLPSSQIIVENAYLRRALNDLSSSCPSTDFYRVEVRMNVTKEKLELVITAHRSLPLCSVSVPVVSNNLSSSCFFYLDYKALSHIIFYSSSDISVWRICLSDDMKFVYFVSDMENMEERQYLSYHEVKNLAEK